MSDGLDALIWPVRPETLEMAWSLTGEAPASSRLTILVTLRARPGQAGGLERAAAEFVQATSRLEGALGSSLHRGRADPLVFILVERFADREAFERHMDSDYFRRFQAAQGPLLSAPVGAVFLERV